MAKKEYRGQRSADSILEFVLEQIKVPVKEWTGRQSLLDQLDEKKHHVVGYFQVNRPFSQTKSFEKIRFLNSFLAWLWIRIQFPDPAVFNNADPDRAFLIRVRIRIQLVKLPYQDFSVKPWSFSKFKWNFLIQLQLILLEPVPISMHSLLFFNFFPPDQGECGSVSTALFFFYSQGAGSSRNLEVLYGIT